MQNDLCITGSLFTNLLLQITATSTCVSVSTFGEAKREINSVLNALLQPGTMQKVTLIDF